MAGPIERIERRSSSVDEGSFLLQMKIRWRWPQNAKDDIHSRAPPLSTVVALAAEQFAARSE